MLEDGNVTWHTAAAWKVRGNVVKGVLVTLASKGARRFLTFALGFLEPDLRELGRVQEDGDVTWHTEQPRGRFAETSSRGVLVTLASKSARRFLTVALGTEEVDVRELGRVLEDGDVTWHTAAARKVRGNVVKGVLVTLGRVRQAPWRFDFPTSARN